MPWLTYPRKARAPAFGGVRRVRPEFGRVWFAVLPNNLGARPLRPMDSAHDANPTYSLAANASPTWPTLGNTRFGPALRFGGTSSSSTYAWGDGSSSSSYNPLPSGGISRATVVVVAQATGNLANNARGFGSSYNQQQCHISISGSSVALTFNSAQYGSTLAQTFSHSSGQAGSNVWTWRGGTDLRGYRNGVAGAAASGASQTVMPRYGNFEFGAATGYAIGMDVSLVLWTDQPIPDTLAIDVSADPWLAFLPDAAVFFYTGGTSDTTPPEWPVGATLSASGVSSSGASLSWTAATDNVAVTQYRYRLNSGAWTTQGATTSATLSSLAENTYYSVDVQAGDSAGNWTSSSLSTSFTTLSSGSQLFPNALDSYTSPLLTYHASGTSGLYTEVQDFGLEISGAWRWSMGYAVLSGAATVYMQLNSAGGEAAKTITGATNASPIVITTSAAHGYVTGDEVLIANVGGNTAANGRWTVTALTTDTFSLQYLGGRNSVGNGAYTSGGTASRWVWAEYPSTSVNASARYVRLRISTTGTLSVTSLGSIYCSVFARSESIPAAGGTLATSASAPTTVELQNHYMRVKSITGTPVGAAARTWVVDKIEVSGGRGMLGGHCLRFDGSGDYVTMGDQSVHTMSTGSADISFTLEAWVRADNLNSAAVIAGKSNDGVTGEYYIYLDTTGQIVGSVIDNTDGGRKKFIAQTSIAANAWRHVAMVYVGSTKAATIYIDGRPVTTVTTTTGTYTRMRDTTYAFQVARQAAGNYFTGCIDEVRLWNVARSESEMAAYYDSSVSSSATGLVGYWKFDDNTGTSATDSTSNAKHGTLNGNSAWRPMDGFDLYVFDGSGTQIAAEWLGRFEGV